MAESNDAQVIRALEKDLFDGQLKIKEARKANFAQSIVVQELTEDKKNLEYDVVHLNGVVRTYASEKATLEGEVIKL